MDNVSDTVESQANNNLNSTNDFESSLEIQIQDLIEDNAEINYEQVLAVITESLSDGELSQLSIEDFSQLIEQQLAESLGANLA